jgi:hypothetical protein
LQPFFLPYSLIFWAVIQKPKTGMAELANKTETPAMP